MTNAVEPRLTHNRDAVARAAAEFADAHGLDQMTLTRVARTLEVSLPALYNHVRSSSDCTAAIALDGLDALTQRLTRARRSVTGEAALRAVAAAWRSFAAEAEGAHPPGRDSDRAFAQLVDLLCQGLLSAAFPHPSRST